MLLLLPLQNSSLQLIHHAIAYLCAFIIYWGRFLGTAGTHWSREHPISNVYTHSFWLRWWHCIICRITLWRSLYMGGNMTPLTYSRGNDNAGVSMYVCKLSSRGLWSGLQTNSTLMKYDDTTLKRSQYQPTVSPHPMASWISTYGWFRVYFFLSEGLVAKFICRIWWLI